MASWCSTGRALSALLPLLLVGCGGQPALPTYGVVSRFTLTDQAGAEFTSEQALRGKVWVADFIFTNCPGPCPRMSGQMRQVQKAFAGVTGVRFVSITVDPARDTPAALAEYARHYEAEPGKWFFLTGPQEKLHDLSRRVFMLGDVDGSLEHSTRFALVDAASHIRGYYVSSQQDAIPTLIADARRLLKESP